MEYGIEPLLPKISTIGCGVMVLFVVVVVDMAVVVIDVII